MGYVTKAKDINVTFRQFSIVDLPGSSDIDFPNSLMKILQKFWTVSKAALFADPANRKPIAKQAPATILQYAWLWQKKLKKLVLNFIDGKKTDEKRARA